MSDLLSNLWGVIAVVFVFFVYIAWLMALFSVLLDLFRDRELSGFAKAIWLLLLIAIPILTTLIYLIVRGGGMGRRSAAQSQAAEAAVDDRIRAVAGTNAASQIAQAKALLDSGAISAAEFEAIKAKALA